MLRYSGSGSAWRRIGITFLLLFAITITMLPTAVLAAPENSPVYSTGYHTVRPGETLSHIARYYGVTVRALINANGLTNANYIYVGQRLYIPMSSGAPASCYSNYYTIQRHKTVTIPTLQRHQW